MVIGFLKAEPRFENLRLSRKDKHLARRASCPASRRVQDLSSDSLLSGGGRRSLPSRAVAVTATIREDFTHALAVVPLQVQGPAAGAVGHGGAGQNRPSCWSTGSGGPLPPRARGHTRCSPARVKIKNWLCAFFLVRLCLTPQKQSPKTNNIMTNF